MFSQVKMGSSIGVLSVKVKNKFVILYIGHTTTLTSLTPLLEYKDIRKRWKITSSRSMGDISRAELDELMGSSNTPVAFASTLLSALFSDEEMRTADNLEDLDTSRIAYIKQTTKRSYSWCIGSNIKSMHEISKTVDTGLKRRLKDIKKKL